MDEIVLRGVAKWPNVPAVHGWLSLDRRGVWRIKGDTISNPAVTAFIGRNYGQDAQGRWFFQNGPQRVYVTLEYTPFVYRVSSGTGGTQDFVTHTGCAARDVRGAWMDENGVLLLETEHGIGLLHDHDLEQAFPCLIDANGNALDEAVLENLFDLLQRGEDVPLWLRAGEANVVVAPIRSGEVPKRFHYVAHPTDGTDRPHQQDAT